LGLRFGALNVRWATALQHCGTRPYQWQRNSIAWSLSTSAAGGPTPNSCLQSPTRVGPSKKELRAPIRLTNALYATARSRLPTGSPTARPGCDAAPEISRAQKRVPWYSPTTPNPQQSVAQWGGLDNPRRTALCLTAQEPPQTPPVEHPLPIARCLSTAAAAAAMTRKSTTACLDLALASQAWYPPCGPAGRFWRPAGATRITCGAWSATAGGTVFAIRACLTGCDVYSADAATTGRPDLSYHSPASTHPRLPGPPLFSGSAGPPSHWCALGKQRQLWNAAGRLGTLQHCFPGMPWGPMPISTPSSSTDPGRFPSQRRVPCVILDHLTPPWPAGS